MTDITLTPSRSVYLSLFPASLREEAHDLSLVLHSEGEGERGELTAALLRASEEALRLSVTAAPGAGVSLETPEEAVTREDWVSSLNVDNFASILDRLEQAGVPGRLLRQLHTSLSDALSAK